MDSTNLQQRIGPDGNAVAPARKRRRRTAGGGATDDCFSCRKRAVKCDRKRPYCTQCIEIGKDCTGYKTTLTWGVGVASRGKLRGLSYPIASPGAHHASDSSSAATVVTARQPSTASAGNDLGAASQPSFNASSASTVKQDSATAATPLSLNPPVERQPTNAPTRSPEEQKFYHPPSLPLPTPQDSSTQWQPAPSFDSMQAHRASDGQRDFSSHQPLHTLQISPMPPPLDMSHAPGATSAVSSYAESEYHTPLEYPRTPRSAGHTESLHRSMSYSWPDPAITASSMNNFMSNDGAMTSYHQPTAPSVDTTSNMLPLNGGTVVSPDVMSSSDFNESAFNRTNSGVRLLTDERTTFPALEANLDDYEESGDQNASRDMSLLDSRFANPFFHIPPRLQSLMDYYSRNICPFIVAFDGPDNPYRQHILQLAMHNEGLQHALAALSTNNQRMRRHDSYKSGFVEEISTNGSDALPSRKDLSEPSAEESIYKQMSIDELNLQLTGPRAAHDDSVLATLLILCLFHVCDSGFSKFKTQLAGVQKLLSLRNPTVQSDFTRWVEMFFIWFDVMTSTVNDREMQINRESLAMLDYSANLGALEQYSGVDGRLFKLIARLGRMNLLAQGRPVRGQRHPHTYTRPSKPLFKRESGLQPNVSTTDYYDNLDGNGWAQPIIDDDNETFAPIGANPNPQFPHPPTGPHHSNPFDDRHEFWAEWHDVRNRLQQWQMSPTSSPLEGGQRDLIHINESFRYSALLYTERLGHPLLPSSHDQFQYLVSQALFHITALAVTSCVNKFLLWPLFMTGTECVDEGHRNIVRLRCRKIMEESGFYNNLSTLEVLERVWSEAGRNVRGLSEQAEMSARRRESTASQTGRYGQAFRWRKAMDRVDGEYIVI